MLLRFWPFLYAYASRGSIRDVIHCILRKNSQSVSCVSASDSRASCIHYGWGCSLWHMLASMDLTCWSAVRFRSTYACMVHMHVVMQAVEAVQGFEPSEFVDSPRESLRNRASVFCAAAILLVFGLPWHCLRLSPHRHAWQRTRLLDCARGPGRFAGSSQV